MRIRYIALTVLLAAMVVVPAMGAIVTSGAFYYNGGLAANSTNETTGAAGSERGLYGIYFTDADSISRLIDVRAWFDKDSINIPAGYLLNTTVNGSSAPATLTYGGNIISTGSLYYQRDGFTEDLYLSYDADTWTPAGNMSGQHVAYLNWDRSLFNVKFKYVVDASGAKYANNPLAATFTNWIDGAPGNILIPITGAENQGYQYMMRYEDVWGMQYYTTVEGSGLTSTLSLLREIGSYSYSSRIQVNETTPAGYNATDYDAWGVTDALIVGIPHEKKVYITAWDPALRTYSVMFNLTSAFEPPEPPGSGDIYVYTYDGSTGALFNGATVTKTDLDDPIYNGYGTSGIDDLPGRVTFQGLYGHSYNFSSTAPGYSTAYANFTFSTSPGIVVLNIYPGGAPIAGTGYLEFLVLDSDNVKLSGVKISLSDGQIKTTVKGFSRFNVTAPVYFTYVASLQDYASTEGNVTSIDQDTVLTEIVLLTEGEAAVPGQPTPTLSRTQHVMNAEDIWYNNLEFLSALIFMAVLIGLFKKMKP